MEEVRFESPEARLPRRLSDIRPKHAPNIKCSRLLGSAVTLARVVHICSIRTLSLTSSA